MPENLATILEKAIQDQVKIRQGHELVMMQDAQAALQANREALAAAHEKTGTVLEDEDVGNIHLGDINYNAVSGVTPGSDQQLQVGPSNGQTPKPQPTTDSNSLLKKAAIGAGLVAAGAIGGPIGSALVGGVLNNTPAAVAPANPGSDTDTQYSLQHDD